MTKDEIAIKHFNATQKALHEVVGLFINAPVGTNDYYPPTVWNAISVLAQIAKDRKES